MKPLGGDPGDKGVKSLKLLHLEANDVSRNHKIFS